MGLQPLLEPVKVKNIYNIKIENQKNKMRGAWCVWQSA